MFDPDTYFISMTAVYLIAHLILIFIMVFCLFRKWQPILVVLLIASIASVIASISNLIITGIRIYGLEGSSHEVIRIVFTFITLSEPIAVVLGCFGIAKLALKLSKQSSNFSTPS